MVLYIVIGAAIAVLKAKKRRRKKMFTEQDAKQAIQEVAKVYGEDGAAIIEKMIRLESGHFKSENYKKTGGAGMEVFGSSYPFGWKTAAEYWKNKPSHKPTGTLTMKENKTGKQKTFLVFPSVTASLMTTAYVISKRDWNAGAWFSKIASEQEKYNKAINSIKARFVNA